MPYDAEEIEAIVAVRALSFAKNIVVPEIIVEGDSMQRQQALMSKEPNLSISLDVNLK